MTRNWLARRASAAMTVLLVIVASVGVDTSASAHPSTPAPPTDLVATAYYRQVHLTWEPGSDDPGLTYRMHNLTLGWTKDTTSSTGGVWAHGPRQGGLDVGVTYTFEVTAVDSDGRESAPSNRVSATIPELGTPTDVQAVLDGDTVKLSWNRPVESAPGTFVTYLMRLNGALERVIWHNHDAIQISIPRVNPGTTHEYTVATGWSTESASALLTVPPSQDTSPPTTPVVKIVYDDTCQILVSEFVEESTDDSTPQSQIRYEGLKRDSRTGEFFVINYDVPIGSETEDSTAFAFRAVDEAGNRSGIAVPEWDLTCPPH